MKFESTNIIKNLLLTFFLISVDQLSKYLIRLSGGFSVCNPNIAFNIKMPLILLVFFWVVIVVYISFLIFNFQFFPLKRDPTKAVAIFNKFTIYKFSNLQIFGLLLILSGAISNLVDRIHFGCVIDFIDLRFWPIFNLADILITAGVIMLLITNLKMKNEK